MKKILLIALAALFCNVAMAQMRVTGTVTSAEDGSPLSDVTLYLKGSTSMVTATDVDGRFVFASIPGNAVIVASSIGFATQEVSVNNRSVVNIILSFDATSLEEVMVVAYGTVKKGSYSGAASVMKADQIENLPVISFEQALAGNVSGVQVSQTSGLPGSFPQLRIRGVGSMNAGNDPLYVIDGVPAISGDYSTANTWTSAMNYLNPSDIESVTVLKDAAAAALYGSRAANGVVLITTKKGSVGKTKFTFKADVGFSDFAVNNYETCTEEETEMLMREMLENTARYQLKYSEEQITNYVNSNIDRYYPARKSGYGYVDWVKALTQTALNQNYEFNASGGSDKTRFFVSVGYNTNESVTVGRFMDRISGTVNFSHKLNRFLNFGVTGQFTNTNQEGNQEGDLYDNPWFNMKVRLTDRWPAYNPDGSYYTDPYYVGATGGYRNQFVNNENQITSSGQRRTIFKPWLEVDIIDGLKAKTIFSYDWLYIDDEFGWLPEHANGQYYGDGFYSHKTHDVQKIVSSTTLNYNKTFGGQHNVSAMVGWESEAHTQSHIILGKADLASGKVVSSSMAATVIDAEGYKDEYAMLSLISNANYDYAGKYYLSGSYRRDGSSRMAPDTRWGNFWSASGSWRITSEAFMQDVHWLNDLRIRASYGVSGTLPSAWYSYKSMYSFGQYGPSKSSYPSAIANSNLTWEKNHSFNIALETRLFNRASLSVDYYNKLTKDLLMNASVAYITGFSSSLRNIGQMRNAGVEVDLNVDILKEKDWRWSVGLSWTTNKNEITQMSFEGEELLSSPYIRKKGYSYYQFRLREYVGVDSETGEALYHKNTKNSDGTYNKDITKKHTEAVAILLEGKSADPKGYGGLRTNLSYKNLSLSLVFNYQYGNWVFDAAGDEIAADGYVSRFNIAKSQLDRWQTPGDITNVPRRELNSEGGYWDSDRHLYRGDFMRLKNMVLSYTLPAKWMKSVGISMARVYASGNNLLTFTKLNFDPEMAGIGGYTNWDTPPMRTMSFGLEINF